MSTIALILIDGLRPEAVTAQRCPNFTSVIDRGASTRRAVSVMPSITLPCHMSIFHSVPPARHGVTTNDWRPMARPLPGLIDAARAAGKRAAFVYSWEPLRDVSRPLSLSYSYFRDAARAEDGDDLMADEAVRVLTRDEVDFLFVYFGTVDTAGHAFGWMSPAYLAQAARVDRQLGRVLSALPGDGHVLVLADHGGHDRTHGTDSPEDMTIPWAIAGPAIRRAREIAAPVSLLDTAPTLARLLGVPADPDWEGRVVSEAFA